MGRDPAKLLRAHSIAEQEQIFDEYFGPLFNNRLVRWMGRQPVAVYSLGIPPSQHAAMLEESGGSGQKLFDTLQAKDTSTCLRFFTRGQLFYVASIWTKV